MRADKTKVTGLLAQGPDKPTPPKGGWDISKRIGETRTVGDLIKIIIPHSFLAGQIDERNL